LPAGIHFRSGESPPDHFRFLTFNFTPSATRAGARDALAAIWIMLGELRQGMVRDLASSRPDDPEIRVDAGELTYLFSFGPKLFDPAGRQEALVDPALRPDRLPALRPAPTGPFRSLRWSDTAQPQAAQTDFAIQLTGTGQLAVSRPIVEIQKLIDDAQLPVRMVCFYSGIHRDDRRSWIDFHDGINNMPSDERRQAIEIADSAHAWLNGGTTIAFLKIAIDLQGWRRLARDKQEALVGRDKLSGCPIERITAGPDGALTLQRAPCPPNSEIDSSWPGEARDPPAPGDLLATASHIHRANLLRQPPATDAANRIYRQGYEFVDSPPDGGVRVGLNFVSFQRDPIALLNILRSAGWMGDANFGGIAGDPAVPAFPLMSLVAGGLFAVPPVDGPFPGHSLFGER
jgi:deferrochelatase/peroxidase EfeB